MTSSVVRLRKIQSTFQSQTCTIRRSWSKLSGLLLVWSTTWSMSSDQTMTSEKRAQQVHDMRTKRLQHPQLALVSVDKGPASPGQTWTACCTISAPIVEFTGLCTFASSTMFTMFTWPFTICLPVLQVPWQCLTMKKHFYNPQNVEIAF